MHVTINGNGGGLALADDPAVWVLVLYECCTFPEEVREGAEVFAGQAFPFVHCVATERNESEVSIKAQLRVRKYVKVRHVPCIVPAVNVGCFCF